MNIASKRGIAVIGSAALVAGAVATSAGALGANDRAPRKAVVKQALNVQDAFSVFASSEAAVRSADQTGLPRAVTSGPLQSAIVRVPARDADGRLIATGSEKEICLMTQEGGRRTGFGGCSPAGPAATGEKPPVSVSVAPNGYRVAGLFPDETHSVRLTSEGGTVEEITLTNNALFVLLKDAPGRLDWKLGEQAYSMQFVNPPLTTHDG